MENNLQKIDPPSVENKQATNKICASNKQYKEYLVKIREFTFFMMCCSVPRLLVLKPTILLYYFGENQKILDNFINFTTKIDRSKFDFGVIYKEDKIIFNDPNRGRYIDDDPYFESVEHIFGHDISLHSSTIYIHDRCKSLNEIPVDNFYMPHEEGVWFKEIKISKKSKESLNENIIGIDDIETYLNKFDVVNGEIKIKYDLNELKEKLKFITEEIVDEYTEKIIDTINKYTEEIIKNAII